MKQKPWRATYLLRKADVLLYTLLAAIFLLEFLVLNFSPLYFYLLITLIAVSIMSIYPKYIKWTLVMMLGLVIIGTAAYFSFPYTPYSAREIGNNFNALGFTLLVDCMIALVIYTMVKNYSVEPSVKRIRALIRRNQTQLLCALLILGIILVAVPIWPISLIYNSYAYHSTPYNALLAKSYNLSVGISVQTDYALIPICSKGANTSFQVSYISEQPAIEFYILNYSGLLSLGVASYQQYSSYIETNASLVTAMGTAGTLNFSVPGECADIGLLTQPNNNFILHVTESYNGTAYNVEIVPVNGAVIVADRTGNMVSSVLSLKNLTEAEYEDFR